MTEPTPLKMQCIERDVYILAYTFQLRLSSSSENWIDRIRREMR